MSEHADEALAPLDRIAHGVTRTTRLLCFLFGAASLMSLVALSIDAMGVLRTIPRSMLPGVLSSALGFAILVLLVQVLPAVLLHYLVRAARRRSPAALLVNLVVLGLLAAALAAPLAEWALFYLLDFLNSPPEPEVNRTAQWLLVVCLEAISAVILWLMLRAWWRAFKGTYVLLRSPSAGGSPAR